jgi:alkylated DNA repair dioxygenase AlkB
MIDICYRYLSLKQIHSMSRNAKTKKTPKNDSFNMDSLNDMANFVTVSDEGQTHNDHYDAINMSDEELVHLSVAFPKQIHSFHGSLTNMLNLHLITNYFDQGYADAIFERLRRISYNSDEESMVRIRGMKIKIPRKQVAYGEPDTTYNFSGISVTARDWSIDGDTDDEKIGKELKYISTVVGRDAGCKFNYTLINNYLNQTNSIGYHSDDERELGRFPIVAGVSFGQEREMYFKSKITQEVIKVRLPHNSLVIMHYPTNTYWEHAIPKKAKQMGQRISLTFRSVDDTLIHKNKGKSKK